MQFKEGAQVFTSDGEEAGKVDRVVLDPITNEITHLVVRKGFLFTEDKVVPIDLVQSATEERVELKGVEDLDALPQFEETYYVRAEETEPGRARAPGAYSPGYVRPYYWYPPPHITWWGTMPYGLYPALRRRGPAQHSRGHCARQGRREGGNRRWRARGRY